MKKDYNIPNVEIIKVQSLGTICNISGENNPTTVPGSTPGTGGNAAPRVV